MNLDDPLGDADVAACVASLRTATAALDRLSPAALSALARAAARFVLAAKRLRRRRAFADARRGAAQHRLSATRPPAASRRDPPSRGEPRHTGPAAPASAPRPAARATSATHATSATTGRRHGRARRCYACRGAYTEAHFFYASLCPPCAARNLAKRAQTADLTGRVALVTGARVTSGYATALKLLRAGAVVIGTTRFPRDAAGRFATENDFDAWSHRLHVVGLDFRSPAWVEAFAAHVTTTFGRLDVLVNNAAQTVRRPAPFYAHLVPRERAPADAVEPRLRPALALGRRFVAEHARHAPRGPARVDIAGALAASLSQARVLPEDGVALGPDAHGVVTADGGAPDLREANTWVRRLGDVATPECLEVLLVNAAAPFVLAGRLRELMARDSVADKWIVNVTAVEGQFARQNKDGRHPHLNMAKAALNMITRTSADDYARDRIYMNSVDVGWFSNGEPVAVADAMRRRGFALPLDVTDAAARVCDPVFTGVRTGVNTHGKLLKDYAAVDW